MTEQSNKIQITADALIALRSNQKLMDEIGLRDPFAQYFDTGDGQKMAAMITNQFDPLYPRYNLARFKYFTARIDGCKFQQIIFLGSGYDTRSIWMDKFQDGSIEVFEVDFPEKLASKRAKLNDAGIKIPSWLHYVSSDLSDENLGSLLIKEGLKIDSKTFVVIEGVLFFLPSKTGERILNPQFLNLAKGSEILADFWTQSRVTALNTIVREKLDKELFDTFPDSNSAATAQNLFYKLGYSESRIKKLDDIVSKIYKNDFSTELSKGWLVLEARV